MNIVDIGYCFFMIKFDLLKDKKKIVGDNSDKKKIVGNNSWFSFNCYLIIHC